MEKSLKNSSLIVKEISFNEIGKIGILLEDGRLFIIPIKYFPELKKLSVQKRKKYTIVDDRTILFSNLNSVYHLEDFIGLENKWRER